MPWSRSAWGIGLLATGVGHAAVITHYSFDDALADVATAGTNADNLTAIDGLGP